MTDDPQQHLICRNRDDGSFEWVNFVDSCEPKWTDDAKTACGFICKELATKFLTKGNWLVADTRGS
jgi:hypothetical protein